MFRDNLLESSLHIAGRKRWPMALAFVLESIAATLVILVPLLTTGVIPVGAAHIPPTVVPLQRVRVVENNSRGTPNQGRSLRPQTQVVEIADNQSRLYLGPARDRAADASLNPNLTSATSGPAPDLSCPRCVAGPAVGHRDLNSSKPLLVSHLSPAQLVYRVEPVYPRTAVLIGLQSEVKLHALIGKDGTIQSLSVTSGHAILAQAALDAVRQWRYRPYVLNGETVEVETFITVNFKHDR